MTSNGPGSADGPHVRPQFPSPPAKVGTSSSRGGKSGAVSPARRAKHKLHPMKAKHPVATKAGDVFLSLEASQAISKGANAPSSRYSRMSALAIFLMAVVFIASTLIIVVWLKPSRKVMICSTTACISHANLLKTAMNTAVKPCANFYSFVCGSWKPASKEKSMIERIYVRSKQNAIQELEGDPNMTPVPLAPRYFQSCMANHSEDLLKSEIKKFKSFKIGFGLQWPEKWPESNKLVKAPLMILLNMTVNWNINLLIKVRAMPAYRSRRKSLYVSSGIWYKWENTTDDQFAALVKEHCDYLGVPSPGSSMELKAHLQAIASGIPKFTSDAREEQKLTLKDVDQFTASWSDQWRQYLNDVYRPEFSWSVDDVLLLQHSAILTHLSDLLGNIPQASFRRVLSWVFIRMFLWTVLGKPEIRIKGDAKTLQAFRKQTCLSHVENNFGLLVLAKHIYAHFNKEVRHNLDVVFDNLREHMKINFGNSSWIDDVVKKKLYSKLDTMWQNLLPDNRFFSNYSLASLYKNFPDIGDSFMDNVINLAKAFRKTVAWEDYISIFSKRLGGGRMTSRYSYYYNSVSMDVGALEPPILYTNVTSAVMYGSLGASLAAAMVQSFDERGIRFNEKGDEIPWWTTGYKEYEERVKCNLGAAASGLSPPHGSPSRTFSSPLYLLLPALGSAYQAYQTSVKDEGNGGMVVLKGLDSYHDDQVFFMTYCFLTCATDSNGDECNVPLRHLHEFAAAFGCTADEEMNPIEKCNFFG